MIPDLTFPDHNRREGQGITVAGRWMDSRQLIFFSVRQNGGGTSTRCTYRVSAFSQTSFPLTAIALPSLPWAWNSHNSNVFDNKGCSTTSPLMNINADGMASPDAFPFSLTDQPTAKIYYLGKHRARAWKNIPLNKQSLRSQTWGSPWGSVGPQRHYIW